MTVETLRDILDYKRQVLEQFLTVASIFGGFAITGIVALRAEERRDRLHASAFFALAAAAMAFILATALDAIWLPISRLEKLDTAEKLQAVLTVGDIVVWSVIVGAISLVIAVCSFGFAHSRRMGISPS